MSGGDIVSLKNHSLKAFGLGASLIIVGVRLLEVEGLRTLNDPFDFRQKGNDNEVLSIALEALDHGRGLAAAARVVTNGDTGLHGRLLNAKRPEADNWPQSDHKLLITFGYSTSALTHKRQWSSNGLLWGYISRQGSGGRRQPPPQPTSI